MISPTPKLLTEADLAGLPRAVSHTPGKLIVRGGFSLYAEDRKTPVADACLNASIAAHDECNARRLAACWNALEGVPTEEIETVLIHGKALKDVVSERDALAGRVAELEAEREQKTINQKINARHAKSVLMDLIDAERRDAYEQGRSTESTSHELAEFQKATGCDTAAQFLAMPWDVLRGRMLGAQADVSTEITDEQIANCFTTVQFGKDDPTPMVWFTRKDVIQTVRNVLAALSATTPESKP